MKYIANIITIIAKFLENKSKNISKRKRHIHCFLNKINRNNMRQLSKLQKQNTSSSTANIRCKVSWSSQSSSSNLKMVERRYPSTIILSNNTQSWPRINMDSCSPWCQGHQRLLLTLNLSRPNSVDLSVSTGIVSAATTSLPEGSNAMVLLANNIRTWTPRLASFLRWVRHRRRPLLITSINITIIAMLLLLSIPTPQWCLHRHTSAIATGASVAAAVLHLRHHIIRLVCTLITMRHRKIFALNSRSIWWYSMTPAVDTIHLLLLPRALEVSVAQVHAASHQSPQTHTHRLLSSLLTVYSRRFRCSPITRVPVLTFTPQRRFNHITTSRCSTKSAWCSHSIIQSKLCPAMPSDSITMSTRRRQRWKDHRLELKLELWIRKLRWSLNSTTTTIWLGTRCLLMTTPCKRNSPRRLNQLTITCLLRWSRHHKHSNSSSRLLLHNSRLPGASPQGLPTLFQPAVNRT